MTVTVPKITCEDETTELCQDVPHIIEGPETLEQCKVNVGEAKCSEVELVLPKQVSHHEHCMLDKNERPILIGKLFADGAARETSLHVLYSRRVNGMAAYLTNRAFTQL